MCNLLKDMWSYLIIFSVILFILAGCLLSIVFYNQLLLLGMESFNAMGVIALVSFVFCIIVAVALLKLLGPSLPTGSRPSTSPSASISASPPALDYPPSYSQLEKGELPSYEEATK